MKKTVAVFGVLIFLFPSVSSASTFTQPQINAIIGLLQAFNVAQSTIDTVLVDLTPTTLTITPTYQQTPVPIFGSITSPQTQPVAPIQSPTPPVAPPWSILLSVQSEYSATSTGPVNTVTSPTVEAQDGMVHIMVSAYDPNGVYQKVPITVTTNDPDLPASWTFNADPHKINFFCVAPIYSTFPDNGCVNANPVSIGTFTFTYTAEGATTTQQVTVLPSQQ